MTGGSSYSLQVSPRRSRLREHVYGVLYVCSTEYFSALRIPRRCPLHIGPAHGGAALHLCVLLERQEIRATGRKAGRAPAVATEDRRRKRRRRAVGIDVRRGARAARHRFPGAFGILASVVSVTIVVKGDGAALVRKGG